MCFYFSLFFLRFFLLISYPPMNPPVLAKEWRKTRRRHYVSLQRKTWRLRWVFLHGGLLSGSNLYGFYFRAPIQTASRIIISCHEDVRTVNPVTSRCWQLLADHIGAYWLEWVGSQTCRRQDSNLQVLGCAMRWDEMSWYGKRLNPWRRCNLNQVCTMMWIAIHRWYVHKDTSGQCLDMIADDHICIQCFKLLADSTAVHAVESDELLHKSVSDSKILYLLKLFHPLCLPCFHRSNIMFTVLEPLLTMWDRRPFFGELLWYHSLWFFMK